MSSRIAPDLGDPVRTAWEIAWVGHAMLHGPLHLFDSNAFYPHPLSLAFSDSLLGYGPAAFFGSGTVAALVRYNLLFLGPGRCASSAPTYWRASSGSAGSEAPPPASPSPTRPTA